MSQIEIKSCHKLEGIVTVPGDKSISHRSVMLGAIATGETYVRKFLRAADCLSTVDAFRNLGVTIEETDKDELRIKGKGLHGLKSPSTIIDAGNSGTTMRLLLGILAGQNFSTCITGDDSLRKRPMGRVTKPLRWMGAKISGAGDGNYAPLEISGAKLKAIDYFSPIASAQVKSCLLLAGLYAEGITSVTEPAQSRDHTERMLESFGAQININGFKASVKGKPILRGREVVVPGDISSAAFFLAAAVILPEARIQIKGVGINPTRTGFLSALKEMGVVIDIDNEHQVSGEPVADISVGSANLRGMTVGGEMIPCLIDEVPILAVVATQAEGDTVIRDAGELRVKETDRLHALAVNLYKMGGRVEELPDGLIIHGNQQLSGAVVSSFGDHRMAMAMVVAGLCARGTTVVRNSECIDISFPDFINALESLRT